MVTVFLRGGLGNQMFQYAAGLGMAKKREEGLLLDTVFLNDRFPRKEFTYRAFDLDIFSIDSHLTPLSKISGRFPIPGVWLGSDLAVLKIKNLFGATHVLKETDSEASIDASIKSCGDTVMWGFWQNEKYFRAIADDVREAFQFRHPIEGEAAVLKRNILESPSVALHVRRGDYLLPKYTKVYAGTDLSYYERAVEYIKKKTDDPRFFVFSDDIAWCRENIKLPPTATYVTPASSGPKASYHLELMSLCKHTIIANSTFSWWGAWLNRNPNKIVIAPRTWYAGSVAADNDIVPERWTKL